MRNPKTLKGGTYSYKNLPAIKILDVYVADGQIVFKTDKKDIKINKSEWKSEKYNFKPVTNGQTNGAGSTSGQSIVTGDDLAGHFYVTSDYSKFNFHEKNRVVHKGHVVALAGSIKKRNLLRDQPILVNEYYDVIDGQHRLQAAESLAVPIYYIIREGLTIEDAIALNINTKNWSLGDYLEHYIAQGIEEYIYFKDFIDKYNLGYSMSIHLLMDGAAIGGGGWNNKQFKNGKLQLKYQDYAEQIGQLCQDLFKFGSFTTERSFVIALVQGMSYAELKPPYIKEKVAAAPDKFTKCSDADTYLRMLEDVINYRARERTRLY